VLEKVVIFIACSVVVGNTMLNAEQKEWAVVTMDRNHNQVLGGLSKCPIGCVSFSPINHSGVS
jgi:hypothetical protein